MHSLNTLYLGMRNSRRTAANIYLISYVLRRALFAITITMLMDYPLMQLFLIFFLSLLTGIIVYKGKPYQVGAKGLVMVNEFIVSWSCALCIAFTPGYLQFSFSVAANIGISVLSLAALVIVIGFGSICYSVCWQISFNQRRKHNRLA